jgi:tetratricopeptide (TPR) repeat protein
MPNHFHPTDSKERFEGRIEELNKFEALLTGQSPKWIIHVPGPGGIGKTKLLEQMRDRSVMLPRTLVTDDLVDFYRPANHTGFGLLNDVTRQLGSKCFPRFAAERAHFRDTLNTEPEPGTRREAADRVTHAFLQDYKALLQDKQRIVLLFDTCEEMHAVTGWFLHTLLPGIARVEREIREVEDGPGEDNDPYATTLVIAGRQRLSFPTELQQRVEQMELPPLTTEEVQRFFCRGGLGREVISDADLVRLHDKCGGRPMYVALSFDWLKNEVGSVGELLDTPDPFGKQLISWVHRLRTDESRAILYTALAWRRMKPALLAQLCDCSEAEAHALVEKLGRFSFTKYRPPTEDFDGSFQLQDEMRMLIRDHTWAAEGYKTEQDLLQQIVTWYAGQAVSALAPDQQWSALPGDGNLTLNWASHQERLPADNDELRSLLVEWLYYSCELDLAQGFELHERLFRKASHYLDLAFCEMLNQEMWRFKDRHSADQRDQLDFRDGLVAFRREDFSRASTLWHSLVRRPQVATPVKATTLMLLVELDSYSGRPDEAIEHAREAETLYNRFILEEKESDPAACEIHERELGQLYNNWGYACRVKNDLQTAMTHYRQTLALPSQPKNVARTLNNLGYVYLQQGDLVQARTYVGQALQIRQKLGIPYELGLGYNTMGLIMEQNGRIDPAADLYRKALLNFAAAESERGQAQAKTYLGRLNRIINDFSEAIVYLEDAVQVFRRLKDDDNLAVALNELGCVYRQRCDAGDWQRAENYLQGSLAISQRLHNPFRQADTWADLAILYCRRAAVVAQRRDTTGEQADAALARAAIVESDGLARTHDFTYLLAKNQRTQGDLAYNEHHIEEAFDFYYRACRLMVQAQVLGKGSAVLLRRRYEEMLDRLQERLQAQESALRLTVAERLIREIGTPTAREAELLTTMKDVLQAAIDLVHSLPPQALTSNLNLYAGRTGQKEKIANE